MNHLYIPKTGRTIYLPSDLSECDGRQYIEMAALILRYQCREIDYDEFRVQAFYKLLDMKQAKPGINDLEKFANIYQHSQLIDSFFEIDDNQNRVIKQYYINNPVLDFRGALTHFYGPSDEFNNVKFGEYVDGLNHFIDFNETGDTRYLYQLMATFYRHKKSFIVVRKMFDKFDGDVRVPYNPASVNDRAKDFTEQHIGLVYGFYLLFASFQKYMTTAKLYVENNEIDLSVLFNDQDPVKVKRSDLRAWA
jgi:hypothetical protein